MNLDNCNLNTKRCIALELLVLPRLSKALICLHKPILLHFFVDISYSKYLFSSKLENWIGIFFIAEIRKRCYGSLMDYRKRDPCLLKLEINEYVTTKMLQERKSTEVLCRKGILTATFKFARNLELVCKRKISELPSILWRLRAHFQRMKWQPNL